MEVNEESWLNDADPSLSCNNNTGPAWRRKWLWLLTDSNDKPAPELPARNINVASCLFKADPLNRSSQISEPRWRKYQPGYPVDSNETEPAAPVKPATILQVESSVSNVLLVFNVLILTR